MSSTLQEELKQRIFDPLEMKDTSFAVTKENESRLVTSYHYDAENKKLIDLLLIQEKFQIMVIL